MSAKKHKKKDRKDKGVTEDGLTEKKKKHKASVKEPDEFLGPEQENDESRELKQEPDVSREADESREPADAADPAHWATRARELVDEAVRIAREDLADKEVTFEDTAKRAEKLIRKQPLAAVGVAAGIGLLAGVLFNGGGRRRRS